MTTIIELFYLVLAQFFFGAYFLIWLSYVGLAKCYFDQRLLCKGKDRSTADLLFEWLGFDQTCKSVCSLL